MSISSNYTSLRDMSVTGVENLNSPPAQISTAQLPLKFVNLISTEFKVESLSNGFGLSTNIFDIVYLVEPVLQNTIDNNLTSYIEIIDLIYVATDTIANVLESSVTYRVLNIGNTPYHALIQRVSIFD